MCTLLAFFVGTLPQWVASIWSLFHYDEALVPWLLRHHLPHIAFSPWFITAPIGALMFATVIIIEWKVPYISKKKLITLQERHTRALSSSDGNEIRRDISSQIPATADPKAEAPKAFSEPIELPKRFVVVDPPREVGPKVVPPRHSEWEKEQEKSGIVHLPRSGESIAASVECELDRIRGFCESLEEDLNEYAEKFGEATMPDAHVILSPVDESIIHDCDAVKKETQGKAFEALARLLSELNEKIAGYNTTRNARTMNKVLRYTHQIIPPAIDKAKMGWASRRLS